MLHSSSVDCSSTPTPVCPLSTAKRSYRIPKKSLIECMHATSMKQKEDDGSLRMCLCVRMCVWGLSGVLQRKDWCLLGKGIMVQLERDESKCGVQTR